MVFTKREEGGFLKTVGSVRYRSKLAMTIGLTPLPQDRNHCDSTN